MKLCRSIFLILISMLLLVGNACAFTDYKQEVSTWNDEMETRNVDPSAGLSDNIDPTVIALSDQIVGSETDPGLQVKLLYQWVTTNIYYDMDAFKEGTETFHTPVDVLENRRGECDAFSLLFQALVQAQDIPCILCKGYALGQGTTLYWNSDNYMLHDVNHNWNEVYLNGEWQRMDTTWDVNNAYTAGYFIAGTPSEQWYDFSTAKLDSTRRIDVRGPLSYDQKSASTETLSSLMTGNNVMLLLLALRAVLFFPGI